MKHAVEIVGWNPLNRAFNASYVGFDGLNLCYNSAGVGHTLLGGGSAGNLNKPQTDIDLSLAGLQAGVEAFESWVDEGGAVKIHSRPKMLIVDPSYKWIARELLGSAFKPYTSDNEINPLVEEDLKYFVCHYLIDNDSWFLVADKSEHDLNFIWNEKPFFDGDDDKKTKSAYFDIYSRFVSGFGDWRGVYGSSGG